METVARCSSDIPISKLVKNTLGGCTCQTSLVSAHLAQRSRFE